MKLIIWHTLKKADWDRKGASDCPCTHTDDALLPTVADEKCHLEVEDLGSGDGVVLILHASNLGGGGSSERLSRAEAIRSAVAEVYGPVVAWCLVTTQHGAGIRKSIGTEPVFYWGCVAAIRDRIRLGATITRDATKRACFDVQTPRTVLPALAILCEGYLVVHESSKNRSTLAQEVTVALTRMGWFEKGNGTPRLQLHCDEERLRQVQGAKWWLTPLGGWKESEEVDVQALKELKKRITEEWAPAPMSRGAADLFGCIGSGGPVSDPVMVARAYLDLAAKLTDGSNS